MIKLVLQTEIKTQEMGKERRKEEEKRRWEEEKRMSEKAKAMISPQERRHGSLL